MRWIQDFKERAPHYSEFMTIVLCVPFTLLYSVKEAIGTLPFVLGAQNVSPYPDGAQTGEESARMVKELADWVIIGHSERRKNFSETDAVLAEKVKQAKEAGLKIIYCVSDDQMTIPQGIDVVAYEPVWAIGTGKTDTPENANTVITNIKAKSQVLTVLYGGSITADSAASFVRQPNIDGVLAGGASLNAEKFAALITKVQ